jgi:ATP-dependent Clp protease ATP-binding subunit ClpX
MLDVMYDLPSLTNVKKCIINKEVIEAAQTPVLIPTGQTKDVPA